MGAAALGWRDTADHLSPPLRIKSNMKASDETATTESVTDLDTAALVESCLAGNGDAWEELLNRYQRLIYSIPIQAGMSRADAAEVFQAVSIRLLRKLSTLRDQQGLAKWIVTTTTRECWRLSRRNRRDKTTAAGNEPDGSYDLSDIAAALPLPDKQQMMLEEQQIVREAVSRLPDKCRELITLLFLRADEPSYQEIARTMNMPAASVGPTRARCLEKLRKLLEDKF